jgi:hypothetical protein
MGSQVPENGTHIGFRVPGKENPKRVPKDGEPGLNSCFQRFGIGFPVLGNPFWVLVPRNPVWVPFSGTREPIVTWLEMEGKIYLNTPTCSKTHRNEIPSAFRS